MPIENECELKMNAHFAKANKTPPTRDILTGLVTIENALQRPSPLTSVLKRCLSSVSVHLDQFYPFSSEVLGLILIVLNDLPRQPDQKVRTFR